MTGAIAPRCTWTEQEDLHLIKLVATYGSKNWAVIAGQLDGRIGKQCRERWRNHLDPTIRHDRFTDPEDKRILELVESLGTRWARISELMVGRTENALKNRYYCFLNKKQRSPPAHRRTAGPRAPKANKSARRVSKSRANNNNNSTPVKRNRPVRQAVRMAKALRDCWMESDSDDNDNDAMDTRNDSAARTAKCVTLVTEPVRPRVDMSVHALLVHASPEHGPTSACAPDLPALRDMLEPSRKRTLSHSSVSVVSDSDSEYKDEELRAAYVLCNLFKA